jgi:hypothetical protein
VCGSLEGIFSCKSKEDQGKIGGYMYMGNGNRDTSILIQLIYHKSTSILSSTPIFLKLRFGALVHWQQRLRDHNKASVLGGSRLTRGRRGHQLVHQLWRMPLAQTCLTIPPTPLEVLLLHSTEQDRHLPRRMGAVVNIPQIPDYLSALKRYPHGAQQ